MTTLLWLTGLIFAALLPWGTNVPTNGRAVLVKVFVILNIAVHLVTQGFMHQSHTSEWSNAETRSQAEVAQKRLHNYIDALAVVPSKIEKEGGWRWTQLVTANFIHGGWLHLVMNLWMFALYGQNLELLFGRRRFLLFLIAAMLGSQCAVLLFTVGTSAYNQPHAGFSGVVYAVLAAYLVCFPRSKVKVALIYDLRFWAAVVFLLLPGAFIFSSGSPSFSELVLVLGVVALFVLIQPEYARFGLPAFVLLGYKLMQDALSFERQIDEFSISVWSHAGGLMVGTVAGLLVNGLKGLYQTWEDPDAPLSARGVKRQKVSLAKLEAAAQNDPEAAKAFLGQRVFVGDAVRATRFYEDVVMERFPDLQLDSRELHSLARMLEFKGMEAAALDAYERLLRCQPLPPGYENAWMQAARLCARIHPERSADCLRYLQRFEEDSGLMRDKFEARRLRAEVLEAAAARGLDRSQIEAEAAAAPIPATSAYTSPSDSGFGGPAQPERRRNVRSGSRMQQIAPIRSADEQAGSSKDLGLHTAPVNPAENAESQLPVGEAGPAAEDTEGKAFPPPRENFPPSIRLPSVTPAADCAEVSAESPVQEVTAGSPSTSDVPQGLPGWGKKPLPLKFRDKAVEIATTGQEKKDEPAVPPAPPPAPPDAPPPLPRSLEQRIGLRSRPPRVDLTNMPPNPYGDDQAEDSR